MLARARGLIGVAGEAPGAAGLLHEPLPRRGVGVVAIDAAGRVHGRVAHLRRLRLRSYFLVAGQAEGRAAALDELRGAALVTRVAALGHGRNVAGEGLAGPRRAVCRT
jgi:hypothetical protein